MESISKNADFFQCETCDFKCCKKSNYEKHLQTQKHKNRTKWHFLEQKNAENAETVKKVFICKKCNKEYNARNSLWYHEKKCNYEKQISKIQVSDYEHKLDSKDEMINLLLSQNKELIDLIKGGLINNTTNNNTTNNTFNLNLFLNETCKHAMNISEFVSSIQMNLDDLEHTGRYGYIEGISNIIVKNLNNLEQHMRPLHCSDFKREVLYIKDNNTWLKETEDKPILTKAIKTIANENIKQISKWKNNYPDCTKSNSTKNDIYLKIVSNSMNGLTKEESEKNINKIITNVAKKVIIEK